MMGFQKIKSSLRRFRRKEDGSATLEFVTIFPFFIIMFISSIEAGILMTRQVMLERGVEMSVRALRLGPPVPPTYDQLKTMICNGAGILPDCLNQLKVELRPIDPFKWSNIPREADCVDREDLIAPAREFDTGVENELMIMRVCFLFDPIFPTSGLGAKIPRANGDAYALVTISAFANEPDRS